MTSSEVVKRRFLPLEAEIEHGGREKCGERQDQPQERCKGKEEEEDRGPRECWLINARDMKMLRDTYVRSHNFQESQNLQRSWEGREDSNERTFFSLRPAALFPERRSNHEISLTES